MLRQRPIPLIVKFHAEIQTMGPKSVVLKLKDGTALFGGRIECLVKVLPGRDELRIDIAIDHVAGAGYGRPVKGAVADACPHVVRDIPCGIDADFRHKRELAALKSSDVGCLRKNPSGRHLIGLVKSADAENGHVLTRNTRGELAQQVHVQPAEIPLKSAAELAAVKAVACVELIENVNAAPLRRIDDVVCDIVSVWTRNASDRRLLKDQHVVVKHSEAFFTLETLLVVQASKSAQKVEATVSITDRMSHEIDLISPETDIAIDSDAASELAWRGDGNTAFQSVERAEKWLNQQRIAGGVRCSGELLMPVLQQKAP